MSAKSLCRMWQSVLVLAVVFFPAMLGAIVVPIVSGPAPAIIDTKPETLNIQSNGRFAVVVEMTTPDGARMIDPGTVAITRVNGQPVEPVWAVPKPSALGDCDEDGIADMKFEFRRCDLRAVLPAPVSRGQSYLQLTIGGQLTDGTHFEGTQTVKVIYHK